MKNFTSEIEKLRITDDYCPGALLGESSDTRTLASLTIIHRAGTENMDGFFFGSLQCLIERTENNTSLQDKIKQVLKHYDRDSSGYTNSGAKEQQRLRREG